jgi:hypothetical protein
VGAAENAIQVAGIRYLIMHPGVLRAGRTNNNAVYDPKIKDYRRFHELAIYGLTDSMAWALPGVFPVGTMAAIEFKTPSGATSPGQREFLIDVARSGNTAMLIRDFNELVAVMEKRVAAEPETGVFIPSGKWNMRESARRRHKPEYFRAGRRF